MFLLEPKKLEAGWERRVYKNTGILLLRHPFLLGTLLLFPLIIGLATKTMPLTALAVIVSWALAPAFILKADRGREISWGYLLKHYSGSWGMVLILGGSLMEVFVIFKQQRLLEDSLSNSAFAYFGLAIVFLGIFYFCFRLLAALVFFFLVFAISRIRAIDDEKAMKAMTLLISLPGTFTRFLITEQGGSVTRALELSSKGVDLNEEFLRRGSAFLLQLPIIWAVAFPPMFGVGCIIDYFLYKEIFLGEKGLHEPSPVAVGNVVPQAG